MHPNHAHRLQILELLYQQLELRPKRPWCHVRSLKQLGECEFSLVALEKLKQVERNGNNYQITGRGIEMHEAVAEPNTD